MKMIVLHIVLTGVSAWLSITARSRDALAIYAIQTAALSGCTGFQIARYRRSPWSKLKVASRFQDMATAWADKGGRKMAMNATTLRHMDTALHLVWWEDGTAYVQGMEIMTLETLENGQFLPVWTPTK